MKLPNKAEVIVGAVLICGASTNVATANEEPVLEIPQETLDLAQTCSIEAAKMPLEQISPKEDYGSKVSIIGSKSLRAVFNPQGLEQYMPSDCMDNEYFKMEREVGLRIKQNGKKVSKIKDVIAPHDDNGDPEDTILRLQKGQSFKIGSKINVDAVVRSYATLKQDEDYFLESTDKVISIGAFTVRKK